MKLHLFRGLLSLAALSVALLAGTDASACCHKKRSSCGCGGGYYGGGWGHAGGWRGGYGGGGGGYGGGWGYASNQGWQAGSAMDSSVGASYGQQPVYATTYPQGAGVGNAWSPSGYNPTGYTVNNGPGSSFIQGATAGALGMPNAGYNRAYPYNGYNGGYSGASPYYGGNPGYYGQNPAGNAGFRLGRRIFGR